MTVKHPAIVQLRGNYSECVNDVLKLLGKCCEEYWVDRTKKGLDIYVSDVNDARKFISRVKKLRKAEIKMSTKYAGLRKGRVRVLFVYSMRF